MQLTVRTQGVQIKLARLNKVDGLSVTALVVILYSSFAKCFH